MWCLHTVIAWTTIHDERVWSVQTYGTTRGWLTNRCAEKNEILLLQCSITSLAALLWVLMKLFAPSGPAPEFDVALPCRRVGDTQQQHGRRTDPSVPSGRLMARQIRPTAPRTQLVAGLWAKSAVPPEVYNEQLSAMLVTIILQPVLDKQPSTN